MNKKILMAFLVSAGLLTSSCEKFLDEKPQSKIEGDAIFSNNANLNAFVLGLYKSWRDGHTDRITMYTGNDEMNIGGNQYRDNRERRGLDVYSNELNSTNGAVNGVWTNRYQIVERAAEGISFLKKTEATNTEEFNIRLAELSFLRAVNNFELVQLFGPIMLKDKDRPELGQKRQPLKAVYEFIEQDLLKAVQYLPEPQNQADKRRATKPLAEALLGKIYLYADVNSGFRSYEKAAIYFEKVYKNPYFGGTGAVLFKDIFDAKKQNTAEYEKEIIYAFRYSNVRGDNNGNQWDFGSRAVANATPVEAAAYFAGFDGVMPTAYAYTDKADKGLWEPGDVRKNESIRFDFVWNGYQPNMGGYIWGDEIDPHVKKFEDPRTAEQGLNSWYSGKNVPFIRFSDVVLNYAECLYKTGRQADAITMINDIVRKRAFGGTITEEQKWPVSMGEQQFMENLMDERMRELCFEGWRKFDLVRTGMLKEKVEARNRWFSLDYKNKHNSVDYHVAAPIENYKLIWPIPLGELQQNPNLSLADQNPNY